MKDTNSFHRIIIVHIVVSIQIYHEDCRRYTNAPDDDLGSRVRHDDAAGRVRRIPVAVAVIESRDRWQAREVRGLTVPVERGRIGRAEPEGRVV